jgi:aspartate 1-decarboxylase
LTAVFDAADIREYERGCTTATTAALPTYAIPRQKSPIISVNGAAAHKASQAIFIICAYGVFEEKELAIQAASCLCRRQPHYPHPPLYRCRSQRFPAAFRCSPYPDSTHR